MDATVWVQRDTDQTPGSTGDVVLVPGGDVVRVADVLDDGTLSWRAEVAPDLLPELPDAGQAPQRVDDAELVRAVEGVITADRTRGG